MLEAYFESVSILSETGSNDTEKIKTYLIKMEAICAQNQVVSHFVTQAKTLLAIDLFNKNALKMKEEDFEHPLNRKKAIAEEPLKLLEENLVETMR